MRLLPTSKFFNAKDFHLTTGATLPELTVAYETFGTLNADRSNAILLCHGYTNHAHAGGDADGWFFRLLGPGKALDTDKYFVICSNMLGSAYGTSGPGSTNPATGKPYGPDFPKYTVRDMIEAQRMLVDHLGIDRLKAVMGYSYGGHLTFMWGAHHPDRMRALIPVAGVIERKTTHADIQRIIAQYENCAGWNGGHYYGNEAVPGGVRERMIEIRIETLHRYGLAAYLDATESDPAKRAKIMRDRSTAWAGEFDANSLYILYEAGIGSTAIPVAHQIKAPLLNVLSRSDSVVDVREGPATVDLLRKAGVQAEMFEIDTDYGHTGPLLEPNKWGPRLAEFLDTIR